MRENIFKRNTMNYNNCRFIYADDTTLLLQMFETINFARFFHRRLFLYRLLISACCIQALKCQSTGMEDHFFKSSKSTALY